MTKTDALIVQRKDLKQAFQDVEFNDVKISNFNDEVFKEIKKSSVVIFIDYLTPRIIKNRYGNPQ